MCTELVALRRLMEAATVRGDHSAHYIRTIVIALNAAGDAEINCDDANDSDLLIDEYYLAIIKSFSFLTVHSNRLQIHMVIK